MMEALPSVLAGDNDRDDYRRDHPGRGRQVDKQTSAKEHPHESASDDRRQNDAQCIPFAGAHGGSPGQHLKSMATHKAADPRDAWREPAEVCRFGLLATVAARNPRRDHL